MLFSDWCSVLAHQAQINFPGGNHDVGKQPRLVVRTDTKVQIPVYGHAVDGNLHATPVNNPKQSDSDWEAMLPDPLQPS
jgi:hypothetical protein